MKGLAGIAVLVLAVVGIAAVAFFGNKLVGLASVVSPQPDFKVEVWGENNIEIFSDSWVKYDSLDDEKIFNLAFTPTGGFDYWIVYEIDGKIFPLQEVRGNDPLGGARQTVGFTFSGRTFGGGDHSIFFAVKDGLGGYGRSNLIRVHVDAPQSASVPPDPLFPDDPLFKGYKDSSVVSDTRDQFADLCWDHRLFNGSDYCCVYGTEASPADATKDRCKYSPDAPPVLPEICGDGIDNDKDGLVDEGCPTSPPKGKPFWRNPVFWFIAGGVLLFIPPVRMLIMRLVPI